MSSAGTDLYDDRNSLLELLARYVSIPDTKDWDDLPPKVFTDPLTWDFQSIGGPSPTPQPLGEIVARLRIGFTGFEATHHSATSPRITIDGDKAHIRAHIRAEHWVPSNLVPSDSSNCWLLVGFYDDEAVRTSDGWRIQSVKLTVTHQENAHLYSLAIAEGRRIHGL